MSKNIVLCGFMGSGKSTIGKRLSRQLGMPFYDSDAFVEQKAGKTVSDIFAQEGEESFRKLETECIKELSQMQGVVIATGGGVVMRPENVAYLKQNGAIVYLNPSLRRLIRNLLTDHSRPLLEGGNKVQKIKTLRAKRHKTYQKVCDVEIKKDKLRESTEAILEFYEKLQKCEATS